MSVDSSTTPETTETAAPADGVNLSANAAEKVRSLLAQEGRDDLALRIAVQPGGCSGLRYQLFFDRATSRALRATVARGRVVHAEGVGLYRDLQAVQTPPRGERRA